MHSCNNLFNAQLLKTHKVWIILHANVFLHWIASFLHVTVNSLPPQKFFVLFCRLLIFFSKSTFSKNSLSGIPSECQTDLIQIRSEILSGLIWVQYVCKSYQQTTLWGNVNEYWSQKQINRKLPITLYLDIVIELLLWSALDLHCHLEDFVGYQWEILKYEFSLHKISLRTQKFWNYSIIKSFYFIYRVFNLLNVRAANREYSDQIALSPS